MQEEVNISISFGGHLHHHTNKKRVSNIMGTLLTREGSFLTSVTLEELSIY
jgi:hypothetical protein